MNFSVVDLYAGAGGLSQGFYAAGFSIQRAVEVDAWAAQTYRSNLGDHVFEGTVAEFIATEAGHYSGVDVLIGGPPCQGFSISARSRTKNSLDSRNDEVMNFLSAVKIIKPSFVLFENVPQFENFKREDGSKYSNILRSKFECFGYDVLFIKLDAVAFGVPQRRHRFFSVAIKKNYSRKGRAIEELLYLGADQGVPMIPAWDAISDLPAVVPRQLAEDAVLDYALEPDNLYQETMRGSCQRIFNHIPMRHSARLVERFKKIQTGQNGVAVWSDAAANRRSDSGKSGTPFEQNHRRMDGSKPAPTITAHMYSTCLHPFQHRNITIREAARLQSFPDSFRFFGKRTTLSNKLLERKGLKADTKLNQLNQVGNAVPPRLSNAIANAFLQIMVGSNAKCA